VEKVPMTDSELRTTVASLKQNADDLIERLENLG
jgi:hypothetical protein